MFFTTAGQDFHHAPKINSIEYTIKYPLVNVTERLIIITAGLYTAGLQKCKPAVNDDNQMNSRIRHIHTILIKRGLTVAAAESCTGGLLSGILTENAGSSAYFMLGVVAYSNRAKSKILNIPPALIKNRGAVSSTVARMMAQGVRTKAQTDFGIAITGIAGPAGGTPLKPVGTVFIAIRNSRTCICKRFQLKGTRGAIRKAACRQALNMLKTLLD